MNKIIKAVPIALKAIGALIILLGVSYVIFVSVYGSALVKRSEKALEILESSLSDKSLGVKTEVTKSMPYFNVEGTDYAGMLTYNGITSFAIASEMTAFPGTHIPAVYSGNIYDGTLVIYAETYRGMFSFVPDSYVGDTFTFTDALGESFTYTASEIRHTKNPENFLKKIEEKNLIILAKSFGEPYTVIVCN